MRIEGGREHTASVHLNSPTNNRVSVVVIRSVLLKSDARKASAAALEPSIESMVYYE